MNCAMADEPESPSVECCEIIFPLLFASDGREQEPHSSCDVLSPAFNPVLIRAPTRIAFNEGRERCGRNKLALKRAGI